MAFTEDQQQFRDVVARFMQDKCPPSEARRLMADERGYDERVWQQLCGELGLAGTHIPQTCGGFGFGPIELGIVCEEMGRALYCGPFLASAVMAAYALMVAGEDSARTRLLPDIASGERVASLVLDDLVDFNALGAQLSVNDGRLSGRADIVLDAHVADTLLVVARNSSGLGLYEVEPSQVAVHSRDSLDPTRKLCSVRFEATACEQVGSFAGAQVRALSDALATALAHEMVGGAQRLFSSTVDYMKLRMQFGRPIGSFQALKHRCADLLLELELARAATHAAAAFLATGEGDQYAANMAKALASDAYISIAKQAIQLRGGIGFTWEEDTHLWFKRAKSSEVLFGSASWHREQMIERMQHAATEVSNV